MITSAIKQEQFGNITDYSAVCPEGLKKYFAYAHFTDNSYCLFSNIFAKNRREAFDIVLSRFEDCFDYIAHISIQADNQFDDE